MSEQSDSTASEPGIQPQPVDRSQLKLPPKHFVTSLRTDLYVLNRPALRRVRGGRGGYGDVGRRAAENVRQSRTSSTGVFCCVCFPKHSGGTSKAESRNRLIILFPRTEIGQWTCIVQVCARLFYDAQLKQASLTHLSHAQIMQLKSDGYVHVAPIMSTAACI